MAVKLTIDRPGFKRFTDRKVDAYLSAIGLALHTFARERASQVNTGVTVQIKRPRKGGRKTSRTIYPHPSKPGESPRRRTGFGHENIVWGYSKRHAAARVGYTRNARYMAFHELGIRYSKKGPQRRPTIIPALEENEPRLVEIGRFEAARVQ